MPKYANQKTYTIRRPETDPPFIQIHETDWIRACNELTYSAFKVYLWLAQNADGFRFAYSPQCIENTGMMAKGTATKARDELEQKGYIVDDVFYVRPPKVVAHLEEMKNSLPSVEDF